MAAMALSPRISFSHDVDIAPPIVDTSLLSAADADFNFSISLDDISIPDPSPADHLFSHGILLPLSSITPSTSATNIPPRSWRAPPLEKDIKESNMTRSSSAGAAKSVGGSKPSSVCPFPRSKSTGSYPKQKQNQNQNQKKNRLSKNANANAKNCYYYSGSGRRSLYGNGMRVNPIINVPAHFIPRGGSSSSTGSGGVSGGGNGINSLFSYLLCNCRDKNDKELVCGGEI